MTKTTERPASNSDDGALFSPHPQQVEVYPSGEYIDLLDPDPKTIHLRDIAHHLSMTCRYAGGVRHFYSVAEHCALVHDLIAAEVDAATEPNRFVELQRAALLHDAAEAYTGDATAPLKWSLRERFTDFAGPNRSSFDKIADRLDRVIATKFDVDPGLFDDPLLKVCDLWAMKIEAKRLTKSGGSNWRWPGTLPHDGELAYGIEFCGGLRSEYARVRYERRAMFYWPDEYRSAR